MISIFVSSIVLFNKPFEFYIHYVFYITMIPLFIMKYGVQRYVVYIMGITLVLGLFDISMGYCQSFSFIKTWGGLLLSILFYSSVLKYYKYDLEYLFQKIMQWSFWMAVIGVFQFLAYFTHIQALYEYKWILNKGGAVLDGGILGPKLVGIFSEPSTVAVVMAPAAYLAFYNLIHAKRYVFSKPQALVVLFFYFACTSSTAYIGVMIILILVTDTIRLRYIAFGAVLLFGAFTVMYNNVEEFRSRVDSSIGLWVHEEYTMENTNTSSFVLYNSFNVAMGNLGEHPLFGTGLGSFENAYEEHTLTRTVISYDFEFNKTDGNSSLLRLLVEVGVIGVSLLVLLLKKAFIGRKAKAEHRAFRIISQSILIMILLYLLRQGNYLINALPLFVMMYYFNWKEYIKVKNKEVPVTV